MSCQAGSGRVPNNVLLPLAVPLGAPRVGGSPMDGGVLRNLFLLPASQWGLRPGLQLRGRRAMEGGIPLMRIACFEGREREEGVGPSFRVSCWSPGPSSSPSSPEASPKGATHRSHSGGRRAADAPKCGKPPTAPPIRASHVTAGHPRLARTTDESHPSGADRPNAFHALPPSPSYGNPGEPHDDASCGTTRDRLPNALQGVSIQLAENSFVRGTLPNSVRRVD